MKHEKIVVLFGGRTGEHEVSLRSAAAVIRNMDSNRWEPVGIGIDFDGSWYLQPSDGLYPEDGSLPLLRDPGKLVSVIPGRGLSARGKGIDCACVLPVLHGTFGEDGTVQGLLEIAGLPYAGSGVLGSALGMDKEMTKLIWMQEGLPVVPFLASGADDAGGFAARVETTFGFPVFVKPVRLGSSVGVSRAESPDELQAALDTAFRFDTRIMAEPEIDGREIECSVVGNRNPRAFGPGEIAPVQGFYSYQAKYVDPHGADLLIPADLPEKVRQDVRNLAVRAYTAIRASGMSRVDFFYEESSNRILLNEINTIPGFTGISMFPMLCEYDGLPFRDLVTELIELGIQRFSERKHLQFKYTG